VVAVRGSVHGRPNTQEDAVHVALRIVETAAEQTRELPFPPAVFGIAAFGGLVVLLLVAYAFRSIGSRH
jgi:hypothetical protein